MLDPEEHDDEIFGFHVQQAIEKALKSWIAFLDLEYPRTHDIMLLLEQLQATGIDIESLAPLAAYSEFAVDSRYADWDNDGCGLDRETVLEKVISLIEDVERLTGLEGTLP